MKGTTKVIYTDVKSPYVIYTIGQYTHANILAPYSETEL